MPRLPAAILRLQLFALATIVSSLPTSSVATLQGAGSAGLVRAGGQRRPDSACMRLRGGGACLPCTGAPEVQVSNAVEHEFVVFFEEQGKADNFAPALVGSWQGWNVSSAVPMYRDSGHVRWSALVSFPTTPGASGVIDVEYKYILVPTVPVQSAETDAQEFLWESGLNRHINLTAASPAHPAPASEESAPASGTGGNQNVRGDHLRHELNAAPACTDVRFEADYSPQSPSEFVAVVGSSTALGRWVPGDALRLTRAGSDSSFWRASLAMPFPRSVEWKFIILDSSDFNHVLWEGGPNRRCVLSHDGAVAKTPETLHLQELTEDSPPPEMMIRSTSNDDMVNNSAKKGPKKVGSSIGRLESFQRVLGHIGAIKNKLQNHNNK